VAVAVQPTSWVGHDLVHFACEADLCIFLCLDIVVLLSPRRSIRRPLDLNDYVRQLTFEVSPAMQRKADLLPVAAGQGGFGILLSHGETEALVRLLESSARSRAQLIPDNNDLV